MSSAGFRKLLSTVGAACKLPPCSPTRVETLLRLFYVTDRHEEVRVTQDWLGHVNVQNTVHYTTLAPGRPDNARAPG
jgi:hypothetical protein